MGHKQKQNEPKKNPGIWTADVGGKKVEGIPDSVLDWYRRQFGDMLLRTVAEELWQLRRVVEKLEKIHGIERGKFTMPDTSGFTPKVIEK